MIEINKITLVTRHTILDNVSYTFHDNSIYGIVAENGSGKTTLFRAMVNLIGIENGNISFDHHSVEDNLHQIFYFENEEWLDKNLNGMDYLKFVQRMWNSKIDIDDIIQIWNMKEYIHVPIKKYSLGMKQRLIIAMYILSDAKYMIMDEITNGLDEENRKLFFEMIIELKNKGKTILISSHYKDEIISYCDIVLQIKDHKLCEVIS